MLGQYWVEHSTRELYPVEVEVSCCRCSWKVMYKFVAYGSSGRKGNESYVVMDVHACYASHLEALNKE